MSRSNLQEPVSVFTTCDLRPSMSAHLQVSMGGGGAVIMDDAGQATIRNELMIHAPGATTLIMN